MYFLIDFSPKTNVSFQQIANFQQKIDSIKQNTKQNQNIYPFNPNYLTDYRAYQLGISSEELARLEAFRKEGKFVHSVQEFQQITQISDSLLEKISTYFKFPEWVNQKKQFSQNKFENHSKANTKNLPKIDINIATTDDLKKINGIGEKLSERIIKYREHLQGFSFKEQINEVYGLQEEVIERIWQQFDIKTLPKIVKIDVNMASKKELTNIPYISYKEAEEIILLRSNSGFINNLDELLQIKSFDTDKIQKIKLYLYAQN